MLSPKKDIPRQWIEGAKNYALADKSDPFTFSRVMSHLENGVCHPDMTPYEAELDFEERKTEYSESYRVPTYKNVKRP